MSNYCKIISMYIRFSPYQHVVGCVRIKEPWIQEPAYVTAQVASVGITVIVSAAVNGHRNRFILCMTCIIYEESAQHAHH